MGTARSLARDPVLRALVALAAVALVVFASGWGGVEARVVLFWIIQVGLDVIFFLGSLRLVRLLALPPPIRRFWRLVAVSGFFFTAADTLQTVVATRSRGTTAVDPGIVQTLVVLAGVGCTVWAMLRHPIQAEGRARLRWWLDAATVMVGAGVFAWYFSVSQSGHRDAADLAVVLVGTGIMLVCALGLIKLLLGGNAPFTRPAGWAGGLSVAFSGVFLGGGKALTESLPLGLVLALRLLPLILLAATPRIQEVQLRADPDVLVHRPRRYSPLPYLAVASTHGLLIGALLGAGLGTRTWGVLAGVIAGTALVVVRQLVAFTDNARLLASLDEAVLATRRQEERFRSLVQHASDLTLVATGLGTITYASPAAHRILGVGPDELIGRRVTERLHPDDRPAVWRTARELSRTAGATITSQIRARHADGSWRWLEFAGTNLLHDPSVGGLICNVRDITDARQFQERLRYQATHDALTGLANRALFDEQSRVDTAGDRRAGDTMGVLALDLNDFKIVNDTLGHHVGDALLTAVAERLLGCVRPTDTVARLGGDEFAILLPGVSEREADAVAVRITEALVSPVWVDDHRLTVRASIGTAVGRLEEVGVLLRAADEAMYRDKRDKRGTKQAAVR